MSKRNVDGLGQEAVPCRLRVHRQDPGHQSRLHVQMLTSGRRYIWSSKPTVLAAPVPSMQGTLHLNLSSYLPANLISSVSI